MNAPGRTATAVEHSAGGFGDYSILCWTRSIEDSLTIHTLPHRAVHPRATNQPTDPCAYVVRCRPAGGDDLPRRGAAAGLVRRAQARGRPLGQLQAVTSCSAVQAVTSCSALHSRHPVGTPSWFGNGPPKRSGLCRSALPYRRRGLLLFCYPSSWVEASNKCTQMPRCGLVHTEDLLIFFQSSSNIMVSPFLINVELEESSNLVAPCLERDDPGHSGGRDYCAAHASLVLGPALCAQLSMTQRDTSGHARPSPRALAVAGHYRMICWSMPRADSLVRMASRADGLVWMDTVCCAASQQAVELHGKQAASRDVRMRLGWAKCVPVFKGAGRPVALVRSRQWHDLTSPRPACCTTMAVAVIKRRVICRAP